VTFAGGKLWRFQYRYDGKQKLLALGIFPTVSLNDARGKRDEAKKQLADGLDPGQLKKEQKISQSQREARSFEVVSREWHEQAKSQLPKKHAGHLLNRLQYDVFPFIGNTPISEVKQSDLLAVLHRIEMRALKTARRMKTAFGQIFRFAILTERAEYNPMDGLEGALSSPKNKDFLRTTDSKTVASLILAMDGYDGPFVVKCAMQLVLFLLVEPEELYHAKWEEIDFLEKQWNMPVQRMKTTQVYIVPLTCQVIETFKQLSSLTGYSKYVFPSCRPSRCLSPNAINAGFRVIGFGKDKIAALGIREVARIILVKGSMINIDVIEHHLSRGIKDSNETVYNPIQFLPQRREMMQIWADYLDNLKEIAMVALPKAHD